MCKITFCILRIFILIPGPHFEVEIKSVNKPIEYWRLWVIELVFVAAPAVFFVLYAR